MTSEMLHLDDHAVRHQRHRVSDVLHIQLAHQNKYMAHNSHMCMVMIELTRQEQRQMLCRSLLQVQTFRTNNKQTTNKQTNNYVQTNSQQVWCMEAAACTIKVQCTTRIWIVYVIMIAHATWLSYNLVHRLTCSWYCHTCNSWYCTDHVCSQWADIMRHTSHRKLALLQIFYVRNINEHSVNLLTNKG